MIRRDLAFQLLALYLLFVGPVVLASLVFDRLTSQRLEADVKVADLALATTIAQETDNVIGNSLQAVRQLAGYPEVLENDLPGMEGLFNLLLSVRPDINLIYRLDADGEMLFHVPTGPGSTVGWDFSGRDYFQRALSSTSPLVSQGRISPTTNQPVATAVMPLWSADGSFLGLVATNIKLESLSQVLSSIAAERRPEEAFQVAIIDSAGRIIAHPQAAFLLSDLNDILPQVSQAVLAGASGNLVAQDENKLEMLHSYVPIPSAGWGVIISRSTSAAFATPRATHRGVLASIGVFLIVGFFFWLALSRRVLQPLERLAAFSQTIGLEGSSTAEHRQALVRLLERSDQIGHLGRSLMRMEKSIEARLNELSTLLETGAAVVSSLDSQTLLERILEQVERLMGLKMCAIVAFDEERGVFRAKASRGLSHRYAEQLAIDPHDPQSVTLRALHSGEPIQVSDTEADPSFSAFRPRSRSEGYRSILAVPLKTQHAPPAALVIYRTDPHLFSPREINLLASFANHATMAIENATLYARSDTRLKEQTHRLEALIQSLGDGLILEDLQKRIIYANRRISDLVELPLSEIIGAHVENIFKRILSNALNTETASAQVETILKGRGDRRVEFALLAGGQTRYLNLQVFDVSDPAGTLIGRGRILQDITRVRELDRMKSSLISTVSHELRTPLAAIKGYATTLLAEDVQWDAQAEKEFLGIISNETDRLSKLVNDLLDMSRIEAGNLIVSKVECQLEELVRNASVQSHPQPKERLTVEIPAGLPPLYVDPQRLEAVLRNLFENAVKYANDESPITVSATRQSSNLVVRVEDCGPGIPADDSQKIFESFYRVEGGLTRPAPGAGLGLAISQGFVRAHGGEMWLEPRSKGTCIAFSIPVETTRS